MKIVCLGDSFTEGYGIPEKGRWTEVVSSLSSHQVMNHGVSGDTTTGMLARLISDVMPLKPDVVILMGGTNDTICGVSYVGVVANLMAMIRLLKKNNITAVVGIPPRAFESDDVKSMVFKTGHFLNSKIDFLREKLIYMVQEDGQLYIDFGVVEQENYLEDGIHPNEVGHLLMAEETLKIINEIGA